MVFKHKSKFKALLITFEMVKIFISNNFTMHMLKKLDIKKQFNFSGICEVLHLFIFSSLFSSTFSALTPRISSRLLFFYLSFHF